MNLEHYDLAPSITAFALPASGTNNTTVGVRTGGGEFVLKCYAVPHGTAGLGYEHDLLAWLQSRHLSFAVPVPVATCTGATYSLRRCISPKCRIVRMVSSVSWRASTHVRNYDDVLSLDVLMERDRPRAPAGAER